MLDTTTITLHTDFRVGHVDERIYGGFIEHMGRCVYEGLYQPGSPHADEHGFRSDVLNALRRLRMTAQRYPGGNFVSGYHWQDGVGHRAERPTVRELAWHSLEPNTFGTDEYITMCRMMGWTPMITVNLGTGTPEEACDWLEYCNGAPGTKYADMRVTNGHRQPFAVKLWCLGNEMDGPWQLGHVPAGEYAIRAQQAAKLMKDADKSIEMVACGSCTINLPTYMEWDRQVLEYIGSLADYVSLHRYIRKPGDDTPDFLAATNSIDRQIEDMDAACRYVQAKTHSKTRPYLCFDEWNVAYHPSENSPEGVFPRHLAEQIYTLEDAIVVAGFFNSFIRHADVLKIANIAQTVNILGPILTRGDELLLQSIFYVFEMFSRRRNGLSLQPLVSGPGYEGKTNGPVTFIDASAIHDGDRLHVFASNRSQSETARLHVQLADRRVAGLESGDILTGASATQANTWEQPNVLQPQPFTAASITGGDAWLDLPPLSVTAATLRLAPAA